MRLLISSLFIVSFVFGIDLKLEISKCAKIQVPQSRLMCYDVITSQIIEPSQFEINGSKLTSECYHCHGGLWELTQRVGSKPVKDMSKDEIKKALYSYKHDNEYGSNLKDVMQNQLRDFDDKDLDTIVDYIIYKRDKQY